MPARAQINRGRALGPAAAVVPARRPGCLRRRQQPDHAQPTRRWRWRRPRERPQRGGDRRRRHRHVRLGRYRGHGAARREPVRDAAAGGGYRLPCRLGAGPAAVLRSSLGTLPRPMARLTRQPRLSHPPRQRLLRLFWRGGRHRPHRLLRTEPGRLAGADAQLERSSPAQQRAVGVGEARARPAAPSLHAGRVAPSSLHVRAERAERLDARHVQPARSRWRGRRRERSRPSLRALCEADGGRPARRPRHPAVHRRHRRRHALSLRDHGAQLGIPHRAVRRAAPDPSTHVLPLGIRRRQRAGWPIPVPISATETGPGLQLR